MFAPAGASARRTALVVIALFVSTIAALVVVPSVAHAAPARQQGHQQARVLTPEQVIARSVLSMLNAERHAHGLRALTMNVRLVRSAHLHNSWMARTNVLSHQEPGEPDLASRITRAGYKWSWAGENIGWNSRMTKAGVRQLESMMYHEKAPNDGHRLNILSTQFTDIGVDVYLDHAHKKVWLTTDFGRPL